MPEDHGGTRRGVQDAPSHRALRLAEEHHDELLTGSSAQVLRDAAEILSDAAADGTTIPPGAAWRFAAAHHHRGEFELAIAWCTAADHDAGADAERALLTAFHASSQWAHGDRAARSTAERALDLARASGDHLALAHAWTADALVHILEGDRDRNRYAHETALEHAQLAGDHYVTIRVLSNLGSMCNEVGRHVEALSHLDEACLLAEVRSAGLLGAIANINRSDALLALGRLDEALVEVGAARDLYHRAGSPMLGLALLAEGELHRHRGSAVRAAASYREAVRRAEATGDVQVLVPALAGLARTTVLADPARATSYAKQALDQPASRSDLSAVLASGWVALAAGDGDHAREAGEHAIDEAGRRQSLPDLADALELRALAEPDNVAAEADLAEAGEIWQESANAIRIEINRAVRARLCGDRGSESAARHNLQALGVRVDLFRIAGPMQAIGRLRRPDVHIQTLGTFSVVVGGTPVAPSSWPSRKSRELIKILASRRGRPISRDRLADLLWPDVLDTSNRLSVALSTARGALDPEKAHPAGRYVVADRDQVHLDLDTVSLDIEEFHRVAQSALAAARRGEWDAVALLQAAASLYPAAFLADEPAPAWADTTRDELHDLSLQVKRTLADLLRSTGRVDQAITWLLALVADDPYDESAHHTLITALHQQGRHGEARRAHRSYAAAMADLDITPKPLSSLLRHEETREAARDGASATAEIVLPTARPLIGRESELARIAELLAGHRCVMLTGTGGIGKTHLAVAAATAFVDRVDATWFVDLSAVDNRPDQAVATVLGVAEESGVALATTLADHIGTRTCLLVLDNCEHLLAAVGELTGELLAGCPHLRVLLTSRERLGLDREVAVELRPLRSRSDAGTAPATDLFMAKARAADPGFTAEPEVVAEVCDRCDGLPLAIELAAARCATLGLDGLLTGLEDRLRLLTGPSAGTGRHRSVRAVLDWSHDLLDPDEQRVFRRLAGFLAPFDLAAAAAVAGEGMSPASVADIVGRLTDKHLLERDGDRWRMLDLVHSYAREQLDASPDAEAVATARLTWATDHAEELSERSRRGQAWREAYNAAAADLQAALSGGAGEHRQRLALALSLAGLEERRGGLTAARQAAETAVAIARTTGDGRQLARAALGASLTGMLFGVTQEHRVSLLTDALDALDDRPDPLRARVMGRLAIELYWSRRREEGIRLADRAVALAEETADDGALAQALQARHYVTRGARTLGQRRALAQRVVHHARHGGETRLELAGRAAYAVDLLEAGELDAMAKEVEDLAAAAQAFGHPEFQSYAATYRLVIALIRGEEKRADTFAAEAEASVHQDKEFGIGLLFARAVTDLRPKSDEELARSQTALAMMATRFPRVIVWRCALLLADLARGTNADAAGWAKALAAEVLELPPDDAHWLLAASMVAEGVAAVPGAAAEYAEPLTQVLRPHADSLAIGGRVAAFRGSVAHSLGLLALACGDTDQAVADFTHACRVHDRMGAIPFAARSRAALDRARSD